MIQDCLTRRQMWEGNKVLGCCIGAFVELETLKSGCLTLPSRPFVWISQFLLDPCLLFVDVKSG